MITILYGNEPFGIQKVVQRFLTLSGGMAERFTAFDAQTAIAACAVSLFTEKKYVLVEIGRLEELAGDFYNYAAHPVATTEVLIRVKDKVDDKGKKFKELAALSDQIAFVKKEHLGADSLREFIEKKAESHGKVMEPAAIATYLERTTYGSDGTTLWQVFYDIENLCDASLSGSVTAADVAQYFDGVKEADGFAFVRALARGDARRAYELADCVPEDKVIGTLSLVERDIRVAYKRSMFSLGEIGAFREPDFKGYDRKTLSELLKIPCAYIRDAKSGRGALPLMRRATAEILGITSRKGSC